MTVKIVTDSASDITQEEAKKLGITIVPTYVRFGSQSYRDGIDIDIDEFYRKLATSTVSPDTAAPSPGDFARVYENIARETNEIVSIHVSQKHSAVIDAALLGKEVAEKNGCRIEVVDSQGVTMWQGLVAIAAAQAAEAGCELQQVIEKVRDTINRLRGLGLLDTLRYAVKGGRLSNSIFKVETILKVKTLVTLRHGEIKPAGLVRSWGKGLERLQDFISSRPNIENIAIAYSTLPDDARKLVDYVKSIFPDLSPHIARLGPTLGTHAGPNTLLVATVQQGKIPLSSPF